MRAPVVLAALGLALGLCAPAEAQLFGRELRERVDRLEAEVQQMRQGAGGSTVQRLAEIEAELQRITGEIERLSYRIETIARDAERRFGDFEFRLTELEGGDVAALPANPPPLGGGGSGGGGGTGGGSGGGFTAVSVSEQRALDDAVRFVQQGRLADADDALDDFLASYPASPLVPRAHYWRGETAFTGGSYQRAARAYLTGYEADPDGPAAADNLVKLGVSLARLGQFNEACLTFTEVRTRFPTSTRAVGEAESEAGRLACG
ncbi:MAG: tol-pal system protein YbgF [Pseudomonadota bacterium]